MNLLKYYVQTFKNFQGYVTRTLIFRYKEPNYFFNFAGKSIYKDLLVTGFKCVCPLPNVKQTKAGVVASPPDWTKNASIPGVLKIKNKVKLFYVHFTQ